MQTAIDDLMGLLAIPGPSTEEAAVAEHIEKALLAMGVPAGDILHDEAQRQSEFGGQHGNMVVRFPAVGGARGPGRMFSTHMDTVALARGCRPRLVTGEPGQPDRIVNDAAGTALGADDREGCAVLLQIARALTGELARHPRPAIALVFTVQEELGLIGARGLDAGLLGIEGPILGFNFDGGGCEHLVTRVTGTERFNVEIHGIASHAGADPAGGVSAAVIAGKAIAELAGQGWQGSIEKDGLAGSANVGVLQGGQNTNVVMNHLLARCEARSHDPAFRKRIREVHEEVFSRAAASTTNRHGECGRVTFSTGPCYESFAIADDAPVVRLCMEAARRCGIDMETVSNDGGMDANWYNARGVPTVTLGLGMRQVHTSREWINLRDFLNACRVTMELLRLSAPGSRASIP